MPPKQDDLAARFDPNKRRPTKFNTGKGAKGSPDLGDDNSAWHETPEQKRKRLEDEMMGISKPASVGPNPPTNSSHDGKDAAAAKKVREQIVSRSNLQELWLAVEPSASVADSYHRRRLVDHHL